MKEPTRLIALRFNNIRSIGKAKLELGKDSSQERATVGSSKKDEFEFDRSRMNASNRKTFDFYREKRQQ